MSPSSCRLQGPGKEPAPLSPSCTRPPPLSPMAPGPAHAGAWQRWEGSSHCGCPLRPGCRRKQGFPGLEQVLPVPSLLQGLGTGCSCWALRREPAAAPARRQQGWSWDFADTTLQCKNRVPSALFYHMHKISAPRGDPGVGVGWPHSIAQGFTLGQKLRKQKAWAKVRKGDSGSNLSTVQAGFGSPGLWLLLPAQSQEQPSMSSKAEHSLTHRDTENGPTSPSWGHLAQQLTCTATSFPPQISFLLPGEKALPVDRGQDRMLRAASTHTAAGPLHNPLSVSLQVAMRGDAVAACFCHATATGRCQRFAAPGDVF